MKAGRLFADDALLPDGWARDVLLEWDGAGQLVSVTPGVAPPHDVTRAAGPVLPGMPNLHSHAFQRAFGGLTEFRATEDDSFWSWRTLMYRYASRVTPDQLEAIATWLFIEMLEAGYTSVCEFHYLHHDLDGRPYADDATLARCILRAAEQAGIGLTLLPVLYQTSGFGGHAPTEAQRRFLRSTDSMLVLLDTLRPTCARQHARLGLALHSLRAVPPDSLRDAVAGLDAMDSTAPIHIHVAEQVREVEECVAWSGQRPVEWLLDHAAVDERWCLIHATHMTPDESRRAAQKAVVAGLCPTTEANLGDGIFDFAAWHDADLPGGGRWGVGSDSHACVNAAEELMVLEYGQRLTRRRRNVAASAAHPHTATALYLSAAGGGAQASGRAVSHDAAAGPAADAGRSGLTAGASADVVVLDAQHPLVAGLDAADMLGAHVFASHRRSAIRDVWVRGAQHVREGRHPRHAAAAAAFVHARRHGLHD